MQLTLIRHLPTEWNEKQKLQGRRNLELTFVTENSKKQMAENQQLLQRLSPFDTILASTLKRTQQTAYLYGYEYEIDSLLDELDFGPYEGVSKQRLLEDYGEQWIHYPEELVLGESMKDFAQRIILFLEKS